MVKRRTYKRRSRSYKRKSSRGYKRRTSYKRKRSYKRRTSYKKRRTSKRKRAPPQARGNYERPCPPGFARGPTGHCRGSKYNVPEYKMPTFDYSLRNLKTGAPLRFGSSGQKNTLADILAARRAASEAGPSYESTGTGTGLLTKSSPVQPYTPLTLSEDPSIFAKGIRSAPPPPILGGRRHYYRRH